MITLCVFTDGRDHIYDMIPSALEHLHGPITRKIIYDDSGNPENRSRLADTFPDFVIAHHLDGRQGFGGAIRFMWRYFAAEESNPWIWHAEDDFLYDRDVNLEAVIETMNVRPELVQMALRRQPWNAQERAAGGIVESNPAAFYDQQVNSPYLAHRQFFTTNPCLYRTALCSLGWPEDPHSEGKFGARLLEDPNTKFGFWGDRASRPWVEHVGKERAGVGY